MLQFLDKYGRPIDFSAMDSGALGKSIHLGLDVWRLENTPESELKQCELSDKEQIRKSKRSFITNKLRKILGLK